MFGGTKQNLVHQETPQRLSQTCLWMFECLLWRYGSTVACHRDRDSGCSRPESCSVWHKPSWRRSPLIPLQSHQNLHRTRETDSWRAQAKPGAHQDPGERSSDPTKDWPTLACELVTRSLWWRRGSSVACCRFRGTECGSVRTGPFEGGRHYLHYLHYSLVSYNRELSHAHHRKLD